MISKKSIITLFAISLQAFLLNAQVRVAGTVRDKETGELLIGASILVQSTNQAKISDNNGAFSLVLDDPSDLEFNYVGYNRQVIRIAPVADTIIDVQLTTNNVLEEVVVKARDKDISNVAGLSTEELQYLPAIGSKPDVFKSLQLLPGIQSQNEGSSLLLIRGGDPGQNLYLIDNIPLIYVNHLGGFMSVFNPDMINKIQVIKGGFPAKYGGKLSSIVDISQREGSVSGKKGSVSIGASDASFNFEGPLKSKSSFIITGRTSLFGLMPLLATRILPDNYYTLYYGFYDINAKYSYKPNSRNSFNINFYRGDDILRYKVKKEALSGYEKGSSNSVWGNFLVSGRWNSLVSAKLSHSTSLSMTRYRLRNKKEYIAGPESENEDFINEFYSSLKDISVISDWKLTLLKFYALNFGLQSSYLVNIPNKTYSNNLTLQTGTVKKKALQSSVYIENKLSFSQYFKADIGLRLSHYHLKDLSITNPEPRVHLNFGLNPDHSISLSYMHTYQYSHLLLAPASINNSETWIPTDSKVQPSFSKQYTLGWMGDFYSHLLSAEINFYYKELSGLVAFKDGYSSLAGDVGYYNKIETGGSGTSKGFELLIKKNYGNLKGFMGYSYSHTTRKFSNLNDGNPYDFEFDRPHTLSFGLGYKFSEKWRMGLSWVFQSGLPYTPAIGRQYATDMDGETYEVLIYGERNSARMKPYHRLDISFNYTKYTNRGRKAEWTFGLYNAYNRQNPFYYYYNTTNTNEMIPPEYYDDYKPLSLYQVSFFPIIPSVSYKVFFDKKIQRNYTKENKLYDWAFYENKTIARHRTKKSKYLLRKLNFQLGYSRYRETDFIFEPFELLDRSKKIDWVNNLKFTANYRFSKFMEAGPYLGYSPYEAFSVTIIEENPEYVHSLASSIGLGNALFYGMNTNFHILPILIKKENFRFDLFASAQLGGIYLNEPVEGMNKKRNYFEYGIFGGLALYPFKHLGFYSEFGFGKNINSKYGVCWKF